MNKIIKHVKKMKLIYLTIAILILSGCSGTINFDIDMKSETEEIWITERCQESEFMDYRCWVEAEEQWYYYLFGEEVGPCIPDMGIGIHCLEDEDWKYYADSEPLKNQNE